MILRRKGVFLFFGMLSIVVGCRNRDKTYSGTRFDQFYFDYSITAEEGDENVTCVFQYKYGGEQGRAMNIEPATVELDGSPIVTDSTKLSGYYYEAQRPIDSFAGKHSVTFITGDGKKYTNDFDFAPFTIQPDLPERINARPFTISLNNLPSAIKQVRLLLLDTAFESSGFNDLVPVANGKIDIDSHILSSIKKGPVVLQLYTEQESPLKQTPLGGKISITYGLKRQFELTN